MDLLHLAPSFWYGSPLLILWITKQGDTHLDTENIRRIATHHHRTQLTHSLTQLPRRWWYTRGEWLRGELACLFWARLWNLKVKLGWEIWWDACVGWRSWCLSSYSLIQEEDEISPQWWRLCYHVCTAQLLGEAWGGLPIYHDSPRPVSPPRWEYYDNSTRNKCGCVGNNWFALFSDTATAPQLLRQHGDTQERGPHRFWRLPLRRWVVDEIVAIQF